MQPNSHNLTHEEIILLQSINEGELAFIDRKKAQALFDRGLAAVASDKHVLLTEAGKKKLRSVAARS